MALTAVQAAMNLDQSKGLHPFFLQPPSVSLSLLSQLQLPLTNPSETQPPNPDDDTMRPPTSVADDPDLEPPETAVKTAKKRGRKPGSKNTKRKQGASEDKQPSLEQFTRRLNGETTTQESPSNGVEATSDAIEEEADITRRKRRKTASPEVHQAAPMKCETPLVTEEKGVAQQQLSETTEGPVHTDAAIAPIVILPQASAGNPTPQDDVSGPVLPDPLHLKDAGPPSMPNPPTQKLLKVNKNGKLLSSPPPSSEIDVTSPRKRRTRKTSKIKYSSMLVVIRYGHDSQSRNSIGKTIAAILEGKQPVPRTSNPPTVAAKPVTKPIVKPSGPPKSTHPFFLGKAAQAKNDDDANNVTDVTTVPPPIRENRRSAVNPGKLMAERRNENSDMSTTAFSLGFNKPRTIKQAGIGEAPWPSQGTSHVRNLDIDSTTLPALSIRHNLLKDRKLKKKVLSVPRDEDLMVKLSQQLELPSHTTSDGSGSEIKPPPEVRLPTRLLLTGAIIQDRVRRQVLGPLPTADAQPTDHKAVHPAVQSLFQAIGHTLTPFDLATCETQSWVQKYAPKQTSHVLQSGREAFVLKDWLKSLTVLTVGGAQSESRPLDAKKPPKKKRKKAVDDFIVFDDEGESEDEEMIEIPNAVANGPASYPISVRRARWTRNQNVVVVSGPPGCGKSAMVYAVAKELGFDVFEINSGSRRSGKDIFDKVGDMSENHLVNHKQRGVAPKLGVASTEDKDNERHGEAFQKDMDNGRQSTMASFFKATPPAKTSPKPKVKETKPRDVAFPAQTTLSGGKEQRNSQKQSLILFEEADVLFEEDQQFWPSILRLASLSKRPIVITCNNELSVPVDQLPLAAVLRPTPPATDLATDYMLVMAGLEGHVLEREAISSLYAYKDHDLRASITELNLWCQMSVGDRKGGLEWMYQRWPPGKDVDENGNVLRVASENTYVTGMGCLSHNIAKSVDNIAFHKQNELLRESWVDWGVEPSACIVDDEGVGQPKIIPDTTLLDMLKELDSLSESVSASDMYCRVDLPSYEQDYHQPTDPSLPPFPESERLNYTTSAPVIQVDHLSDYDKFDTDLSIQSHLLIRRVYGDRPSSTLEKSYQVPATEADFTQAILRQKQASQKKDSLTRSDFSEAFDILAIPPETSATASTSYHLFASSFDRTFGIVTKDIAPYVRSIVAYESLLDAQRIRLGNLLSEGGQAGTKRSRTTRAARTAIEGGERQMKRRERWFDKDLNHQLVMHTAGKTWAGIGLDTTLIGTGTGSIQTEDSRSDSPET